MSFLNQTIGKIEKYLIFKIKIKIVTSVTIFLLLILWIE